jgi:hypothetical protein
MDFSKRYPHIAWWIDNQGWIEIGTDEYSESLIRLLDEGGTWWKDETAETLDEAFNNAEVYLSEGLFERFGNRFDLEK